MAGKQPRTLWTVAAVLTAHIIVFVGLLVHRSQQQLSWPRPAPESFGSSPGARELDRALTTGPENGQLAIAPSTAEQISVPSRVEPGALVSHASVMVETEPAADLAALESYVVVPGDTLTKIAKRHRTTVIELQKSNELATDRLLVGQRLRIPAPQP